MEAWFLEIFSFTSQVVRFAGKLKKQQHEVATTIGTIWVFPKIGVPPNHPFLIGISIINHPFWGIPIFGNTHINLRFGNFLIFKFMNLFFCLENLHALKFNSEFAPENKQGPKRKPDHLPSIPSFFRGELLNFWGVRSRVFFNIKMATTWICVLGDFYRNWNPILLYGKS